MMHNRRSGQSIAQIETILAREARARLRNFYHVVTTCQRPVISPHNDGITRVPHRGQSADGTWGWYLPHPYVREHEDFIPERLPPWVNQMKYSEDTTGITSAHPLPCWVQSPAGLWGWAVREEEFANGLWVNQNPWTMHYYCTNWEDAQVLVEATINTQLRWPHDEHPNWANVNPDFHWHELQPVEGTEPEVGEVPWRQHCFDSHPAPFRKKGTWNVFNPEDLREGWLRDTLLGPEAIRGALHPVFVVNKFGGYGRYLRSEISERRVTRFRGVIVADQWRGSPMRALRAQETYTPQVVGFAPGREYPWPEQGVRGHTLPCGPDPDHQWTEADKRVNVTCDPERVTKRRNPIDEVIIEDSDEVGQNSETEEDQSGQLITALDDSFI